MSDHVIIPCYNSICDHVIIQFELSCYTDKRNSNTVKLNFKKANFDQLNTLIRGVQWESFDECTLQSYYRFFKDAIGNIVAECIPPTRGHPKRRNLYMNSHAMQLRRKKEHLWNKYARTKEPIDHARFARCRNQLRSLTRRLRAQFEAELAADIKQNPKRFILAIHQLAPKDKIKNRRVARQPWCSSKLRQRKSRNAEPIF